MEILVNTVTIAQSASLSGAAECINGKIIGIRVPEITSATLTLYADAPSGGGAPVVGGTFSTAAGSNVVMLDPQYQDIPSLKIHLSVQQDAAARSFGVMIKLR